MQGREDFVGPLMTYTGTSTRRSISDPLGICEAPAQPRAQHQVRVRWPRLCGRVLGAPPGSLAAALLFRPVHRQWSQELAERATGAQVLKEGRWQRTKEVRACRGSGSCQTLCLLDRLRLSKPAPRSSACADNSLMPSVDRPPAEPWLACCARVCLTYPAVSAKGCHRRCCPPCT